MDTVGISDQTLGVLGLELPTAKIANALVDGLAQSLVGSLAWIALTVIYHQLRLREAAANDWQRECDADRARAPASKRGHAA